MPARNATGTAADFLPPKLSLSSLQEAVQTCHGCDLYKHATQAVFGEGRRSSAIVLIGEQPGDEEDRQGRPFAGPAGRILDRALVEAGIDRPAVYVTNAVKHFKFEERARRRIHKKPNGTELKACKPWLEAEMAVIRPSVQVCLGASAAQTVFGPAWRVTRERGRFVEHPWAPHATSYHSSVRDSSRAHGRTAPRGIRGVCGGFEKGSRARASGVNSSSGSVQCLRDLVYPISPMQAVQNIGSPA